MSTQDKLLLKELDKDTTKGDPEHYYVKLVIFKARRRLLIFGSCVFFVFALLLIAKDLRADTSWFLMGLPIIIGGIMMCLVPPTEEWEYKPWQAQARRYESHQIQRQ